VNATSHHIEVYELRRAGAFAVSLCVGFLVYASLIMSGTGLLGLPFWAGMSVVAIITPVASILKNRQFKRTITLAENRMKALDSQIRELKRKIERQERLARNIAVIIKGKTVCQRGDTFVCGWAECASRFRRVLQASFLGPFPIPRSF
jgi:uncharacterized membrane protein YhdT